MTNPVPRPEPAFHDGPPRILYLAGPMTGYEDYNYPAFHAAAEEWRERGWVVRNPAENFFGDQSLPYDYYLRAAVRQVAECDALIVLPGWEASRGAILEVHCAEVLGLPVWDARHPFQQGGEVPADVPHDVTDDVTDDLTSGQYRTVSLVVDEDTGKSFDTPVFLAEKKPLLDDETLRRAAQAFTPKKVDDYSGKIDGAGYKGSMDDSGKLPIQLVPPALIEGTAAVLGYGARKYAPGNWMRGMKWSEVYGAIQRHLNAWYAGEDLDRESELNHVKHVACCVAFLLHYIENDGYSRFDDRVFRVNGEVAA